MNLKLIAFIFTFCIILFSILFYRQHPLSATVKINNTEFIVELAVTPDEKEKGLGDRKTLLPRNGMIFPYDHKEQYNFWMKGMQFPLDFIWISDNKVVDITKNVQPPTETNMHEVRPTVPVNKILEINAGEVDAFGIQVGDTVIYNK